LIQLESVDPNIEADMNRRSGRYWLVWTTSRPANFVGFKVYR
jgi:hypothetical protein